MENKFVELLAPCGSEESFFAAIKNGASAVYLGVQSFNARMKTNNFTFENLEKLVQFAHLHEVKVFLTLNTLISNSEVAEFLQVAVRAYNLGIDAIIVQDIGMALAIKKLLPQMPIHASTQMGVHNLAGAKVLEEMGFSRVIVSRETKLQDIRDIKEHTNLEIEAFVQGALCVAFSGACYLSSVMCGKSGNRGQCSQLCRLPYGVFDHGKTSEKEYLLSAKDLCLAKRLRELKDAGVCSFKIEGRARRAGYVAAVVHTYREIINNDFAVDNSQIEALKLAFNRGNFCDGYLNNGTPDAIIEKDVQGHIGVLAGKVCSFSFGKKFNVLEIISSKKIEKGDGLKFFRDGKEISSIGVQDVLEIQKNKFRITSTNRLLRVGDDVFLTLDKSREDFLQEADDRIKVDCHFVAKIGVKPVLNLFYKSHVVCEVGNNLCEAAKNMPTTFADVKKQLQKKSDEVFELCISEVDAEGVFLPVSVLNEIRRSAIEKLKQVVLLPTKRKEVVFDFIEDIKTEKQKEHFNGDLVFFEKIEDLNAAKPKKDDILVFDPQLYCENSFIDLKKQNNKVFLNLPTYATGKEVQMLLDFAKKYFDGVVANNIYGLMFSRHGIAVFGGASLNVFNFVSDRALKKLGTIRNTVSFELPLEEQEEFDDCYKMQNIFLPLMTFCHCPNKTINGGTCKTCKNEGDLTFVSEGMQSFRIVRKKVLNCTFSFCAVAAKENASCKNLVKKL
ncbi:MAG: U32 family peptidase [Clostridia bacterium]